MPEANGGKEAGWAGDCDAMARLCVMRVDGIWLLQVIVNNEE